MRKRILLVIGLLVIVLGTYLLIGLTQTKQTNELVKQANIQELVQNLSAGKVLAKSASIDSKQLVVTEDNNQTATYELPQDEFFLSIAPYVAQTHPCEIHSLTGCQGEMINEQFSVTIHDSEGNTFMKESVMKSGANGFMDMWLPRDRTYLIRVVHDGKVAETQLSTYEKDNTCITTMQLS
ncbi:CueP family metal-binding protein [Paenibacillus xylanexedens]|uniref:CueP family metal-binding protein n=1 Tax=Paenibacillus xylanexedens TaxID=528191 RepID=UPI0011A579A5|nr:CueP family metal-binding protein [Paenibacillus xylanexedens]